MYRVFINNVKVSFTENPSKKANCLNIVMKNTKVFEHIYKLCMLEKNEGEMGSFCIISKKPKKAFKKFKASFENIKAAGGIVQNKKGEILMIYRLNTWDLPKGKIEKDEKKQAAALREVEEECGITDLNITKKLPKTYHMYELKGKPVLKTTYWYEMRYKGDELPTPQTEEDISEAQWCDRSFVLDVLKNKSSYKNIEILLEDYLEL
ncbi:NUDIX hydrolase [Ornithobacterium rhinotracheale]|uniref:NUDIX hydrolase n=1 Tax=Ornithobacterium rhinotracheale TaxID=28251 RepID=UPI004036C74F